MIGSNSMCFFLHIIPLLFFSFPNFLYTSGSLTRDLCRSDQRDTLLEFKNEFEIRNPLYFDNENDYGGAETSPISTYPKTKSWRNSSDCCFWDGITCDVNSGVVVGLDLSCSRLHGNFKANSSLLRLLHLQNLNLAYNNFTYSPIPTRLNKLTRLERLNISHSSFSGQIPTEILHLTKLVSLDLSSTLILFSHNLLFIRDPFLHLLSKNLTNLRELDMSFVNISSQIPRIISNITSLRSIRFRDCHLLGSLPRNVLLSPTIQSIDFSYNSDLEISLPEFNGNNSLVLLDLSETSLSGNIPNSIINLKHLNVLRFRNCSFTRKIPSSIGNLSHLTSLVLSYNNFSGEIPSSFQNLNRLTRLVIGNNKLSGNFPTILLNLTKLSRLSLFENQFTGTLPPNLTSLSNLESFDASDNAFVGIIPSSLFIISLTFIDLRDNQLNGTLELGTISSPSKLDWLDISNNNIAIDLNAVLSHFKRLSVLDLSGNHVSATNMSPILDPSSYLKFFILRGCGISKFPEFIRTQQHLRILDLSNNIIKDQVPGWLWSLPKLEMVYLSNNGFSGFDGFTRDFSRPRIYLLYLSINNFSGEIPKLLCGITSLEVLDLSRNNLNGSVPQCFNTLIKRSLSDLNLANNNLSGKLPEIFPNGSNLRSLNVGHNQLVGKLPRSLSGSSHLEVLNVEHNRINDTFPFWMESLPKLQVMVLKSNEFHGSLRYHPKIASWFPQLQIIDISHNFFTGTLPSNFFMYWSAIALKRDRSELEYIGDKSVYYQDSMVLMNKGVETEYTMILTLLTAIDFSGNRLQGQIPKSVGLLKNLKMLNLSRNGFIGNIPSSLANLSEMESLDLSHNKLSGQIPPALAYLTGLSKIMVSHNQLVGPIPKSTQFDTQDASSFEGNLGLCGRPLTTSCGDVDTEQSQEAELEEKEEEDGVISWTAAAIAVAPGVIFGLTIGHIFITLKPQWFIKISCVTTKPRRRGSR